MDVDHHIERGVTAARARGELAVAECEIREPLGAAFLARELDERAVGLEADRREAGLGEHEREVARAAAHVEDLHVATRRIRRALLDELEDFALQVLIRPEALEDRVVNDPVSHGQHPIEAPLQGPHHRAHHALRRRPAAGLRAHRRHQRESCLRSVRTFSTVPRSSSEVNGFRRIESKPRRLASVTTSGEPCPVTSTTASSGCSVLAW